MSVAIQYAAIPPRYGGYPNSLLHVRKMIAKKPKPRPQSNQPKSDQNATPVCQSPMQGEAILVRLMPYPPRSTPLPGFL